MNTNIHNVKTIVSGKIKKLKTENGVFFTRQFIFVGEKETLDVTAFSNTKEGLMTS